MTAVAELASKLSLDSQIACVKREIAMRERVYPRWRDMTEHQKTHEINAMRSVLATLEWLKANEDRIRGALQQSAP